MPTLLKRLEFVSVTAGM